MIVDSAGARDQAVAAPLTSQQAAVVTCVKAPPSPSISIPPRVDLLFTLDEGPIQRAIAREGDVLKEDDGLSVGPPAARGLEIQNLDNQPGSP